MVRPQCKKRIECNPPYTQFKPEGCPSQKLETTQLSLEEVEALRLKNIEDLDQTSAAKKMGVSQSTFQRILSSAYKKISEAILFGKEIQLIDKEQKQWNKQNGPQSPIKT
jgi:predicted DNA-binding protein (UPF0251 family)